MMFYASTVVHSRSLPPILAGSVLAKLYVCANKYPVGVSNMVGAVSAHLCCMLSLTNMLFKFSTVIAVADRVKASQEGE